MTCINGGCKVGRAIERSTEADTSCNLFSGKFGLWSQLILCVPVYIINDNVLFIIEA